MVIAGLIGHYLSVAITGNTNSHPIDFNRDRNRNSHWLGCWATYETRIQHASLELRLAVNCQALKIYLQKETKTHGSQQCCTPNTDRPFAAGMPGDPVDRRGSAGHDRGAGRVLSLPGDPLPHRHGVRRQPGRCSRRRRTARLRRNEHILLVFVLAGRWSTARSITAATSCSRSAAGWSWHRPWRKGAAM